jgi:hypothetical protein
MPGRLDEVATTRTDSGTGSRVLLTRASSGSYRRSHWSSLLLPTWLPPPVGVGTFSLHWRFPPIRLLLIRTPPLF